VLFLGVVLGLILGLLAGGSLDNLVAVRLRWIGLLFIAAVIRFGTEFGLIQGIGFAETFRFPLFVLAYGLLLIALYRNRSQPGIAVAFVGILGNALAIIVNGGYMPIWEPSLVAAGFGPADLTSPLHVLVAAPLDANFLQHATFLGDIIPIPLPILNNVASIGDIFLSLGLAFFLFATVVRSSTDVDVEAPIGAPSRARLAGALGTREGRLEPAAAGALAGGSAAAGAATTAALVRPIETGLNPNLAEAAALERPLILGGSAAGLASPAIASVAFETPADRALRRSLVPTLLDRALRHPYVRLALNGSFSALWVGQLISLLGDRIHQIALAFLILNATNSPLAVGLVFLAATAPNLLLGPIAGTFVDRWDRRETMIVSDLLRASIVLMIPIAAVTNLALVYPLVFLVTSISIFFRPARTAIIPRIVAEDELMTANSATWISETLADVVGYPLAGLFVGFLGRALPLAFWFDSATYLASAILIGTMAVPPLLSAARVRSVRADDAEHEAVEEATAMAESDGTPETIDGRAVAADDADEPAPIPPGLRPALALFREELLEGWHFLRGESVLLANTLQATVGQFTAGVLLALAPFYAAESITHGGFDATTAYAFLETGIGAGNLIGGFVLGLIGARLAKGRLVVAGYAIWGLCTIGLAFAGDLGLALGLMFGSGVANMIYVIPSQTMFQERTPQRLMGRVVGFRFSLVFGSMTIAMGISGLMAQEFGVAPVIGAFGAVTLITGLAGALVPAVRNA